MLGYLELRYISPMSGYRFNKNQRYTMVITVTASNNRVYIYKVSFDGLDNINDKVHGYPIGKAILPPPSRFSALINVKLYMHDNIGHNIILLFSGTLDLDSLETGGVKYIELRRTENKDMRFINDVDYLNEKFNKLEELSGKDAVYIYISRVDKSNFPIMNASIIDFDADPTELWIYDRYINSVFKEFVPFELKHGSKREKINEEVEYYIKNFILGKKYMKSIYQPERQLAYLEYNSQNVNIMNKYRPLRFDPYINSSVTAISDGKLKGFDINSTLRIASNEKVYTLDELVNDSAAYDGGSGYISRVSPTDFQKVYMPYSGYLKNVSYGNTGKHGNDGGQHVVNLRFESAFFIPAGVHERDLLSVTNGNWTYGGVGVGAGNRNWPVLLEKNPNTYLIFNVIIIVPSYKDAFIFTNKKQITQWFDQGEELGKLTFGFSNVVYICNRPIDFTSDIKYYSKMTDDTSLKNKIDTFIKARDIVGIMN